MKSATGPDYSPQNSRYRKSAIGISLVLLVTAGVVLWRGLSYPYESVPFPKTYPAHFERALGAFQMQGSIGRAEYEELVAYFVQGYLFYRSDGGAQVNYPGWPSKHGRKVDQLEGFTRIAPLLGAWLYSGREASLMLPDGQRVDLAALLRQGLVSGTNPQSEEYWGPMTRMDQRIVEAADVALALWMSRDQVWNRLNSQQQEHLAVWLAQVNDHRVPHNNWHLFVVLVNAVLLDLGRPEGRVDQLQEHYQRHKDLYRGGGWYTDGLREGERFDYYNAWAIHYALYWIDRVRPQLDREFIRQSLGEFLSGYRYLFGAEGLPIMGRSICYRLAAPAPLVLGHGDHGNRISAGEARRALDLTWRYFIRHGALRSGTVTQGYCAADPRILDDYSGPGSCLWSLRSLIAAISLRKESAFWRHEPTPLPLESGQHYSLDLGQTYWRVEGDPGTGTITLLRNDGGGEVRSQVLNPYSWRERLMEYVTHKIHRPANKEAKYNSAHYSSTDPFTHCPAP